jgi:hypothetical protein
MAPQTNSPLRDRSPTLERGHAPAETELGRAGAHVALIAFAAIAWTAVTAAVDAYYGREVVQSSTYGQHDIVTLLILATFSAPTLFVWGACAAACWQQFRRERSFEPQFDHIARPDKPALPAGSLGAAASNAWMAGLAAVLVLALAFEFGLALPRWAILAIYSAAVAAAGLATLLRSWRPALSPTERWGRLVRKTRWAPFFTRPGVSRERHLLVIRERWGLRLLLAPAFLGAGMFGFLAFWRNPWGTLHDTPGPVLVLLQFVLACFVLVAVHCLKDQARLVCSLCPPQLTVSYGWLLRPERFAFDPRELSVSIALDEPRMAGTNAKRPPVASLSRNEEPARRFRLAAAEYGANVYEIFEPLAEMLGGPSENQTLVETELPNGRRIQVSRAPRCDGAYYRKLRFAGPDLARVSPTGTMRFIYVACLGFAAFGAAGLAASLQQAEEANRWIPVGFCSLFAGAFGIIGLGGLCFERSTRIDLRRGTVENISAPPWRRPKSLRQNEIAAIQICSVPHEDSSPLYQLNWVLVSPEGQRLPILDGHNQQLIERWARELGEFLDKPVLDHREG